MAANVGGINGSAAVSESVQKLRFGVQLAVRPLVDENGWITLDVVPSVSNPDFQLTQLVRVTTGTPQETIAFSERSGAFASPRDDHCQQRQRAWQRLDEQDRSFGRGRA